MEYLPTISHNIAYYVETFEHLNVGKYATSVDCLGTLHVLLLSGTSLWWQLASSPIACGFSMIIPLRRERERETETQRHRDTETQRHRDTERERERERARETERNRQRERERDRLHVADQSMDEIHTACCSIF